MAGLGLPKTGRIGFEIFDKTNFSATDFAEHVNYRRAIEGELERSVMSLAEVEQARVHVTFPKESVFLDSREAAKASVLVRLRAGAQLSGTNVSAITHLVASAVEGLAPESVSVVDMRGTLLTGGRRTIPDDSGSTSASLDYQQGIEKELTAKINGTLEPLLGSGKFRTGVSVECDMTTGEQSEETFDPTKSVMVASQRTEELPGSAALGAGIPGTAANLPRPPAKLSGASTGPTRKTESITYQSSRTVRHTKLPQGIIKHLAVAVLVDQDVKWDGQGKQMKRSLVPPSPEKMKTIHEVVATLVGFSTTRGDQLTVETLPFDSTLNSEPPLPPDPNANQKKPQDLFSRLLGEKQMTTYIAIGAVCLVLGAILVVMLRGRRRAGVETPQAEISGVDRVAISGKSESSKSEGHLALPAPTLVPASPTEALLLQLRESAKKDAEPWAAIIRSWLAQEKSDVRV
jgi:flagellar M-ring protein FliF